MNGGYPLNRIVITLLTELCSPIYRLPNGDVTTPIYRKIPRSTVEMLTMINRVCSVS